MAPAAPIAKSNHKFSQRRKLGIKEFFQVPGTPRRHRISGPPRNRLANMGLQGNLAQSL